MKAINSLSRWQYPFLIPAVAFSASMVAYVAVFMVQRQFGAFSWLLTIIAIASFAIGVSYRIPLGTINGIPPLGGVVVLLAAMNIIDRPMLAVGIFVCGLLIGYSFILRNAVFALYAAGIGGLGGLAYVFAARHLLLAGWWPIAIFAIATTAYFASILLIEFARNKGEWSPNQQKGVAAVRWRPLGILWAVCVAASTIVFTAITEFPAAVLDQRVLHAGFILALGGMLFFALSMSARFSQVLRKLNGLVAASMSLPGDGVTATPESVLQLVQETIEAETAELRATPAGSNEISASTTLGNGENMFVVASRKLSSTPFTAEDQRVLEGLTYIGSEAIRTKQDVATLTAEVNTDSLTGLPNHRAFQIALIAINENRAYSDAIAVLFIDVDDFKMQNDEYGHHAGDKLLIAVAHRMVGAVRNRDSVFRVGGDEFVIILDHVSSLAEAKTIAERVVAEVGVPVNIDDAGLTLTPVVSVGMAFSANREADINALVVDADRTMLDVKRSSHRDGSSSKLEVSASAQRSSRLNDIVAHAIDEHLLTVAFQPIVSITDERIWGFEALVRYTDPELGTIPASALVERAKNLGRLNKLTKQILSRAMEAATEFAAIVPGITVMAVNVEAGQLLEPELNRLFADAPMAYPAATLCLELNERSVGTARSELRAQVDRLRECGVLIALDDYGSENSSVGALVRLPLDILKIDRSLVTNLSDVRQHEFVRALRSFAETMDYSIVVEGIEDAESVDKLRKLEVRMVQGFYYGRPISFEDTCQRLRAHGASAVVPVAPSAQQHTPQTQKI